MLSKDVLSDQLLWVLRNARLHAAEPTLRTAAGFADGAGRAAPVHRSQVGRWERGAVDLTHELVRRYEMVLDLPVGQLLCAMDYFSRARQPVRAAATLPDRGDPDVPETLELLERALAPERLTGLDWDRLSNNLGRMPHAMVRSGDWEHLLRRCTQELIVGVHLEYAQRAEAVARLAGHPRSGVVVARMAADVMGDPHGQFFSDTLTLLQYTSDPEALRVLLEQLREPTSPDALRACLIALTSLVTGADVPAAVVGEAAQLSVGLLRDASLPYRVHRGAANLLRAVELPHRDRLARVLTADDRHFAASIILEGRAIDAQTVKGAHRRIRAALERRPGAGEHDPVLDRLVRTAVSDTNEEAKSIALSILMLSPQAYDIGRQYAAELSAALRRGDDVGVHECLSVITWMCQGDDLPFFVDLAVAPDTPADVAMEVAVAAGNSVDDGSPAAETRTERVRARFAEIVQRRELEGAHDRLRGLAYVLGMRGRFDLIAELESSLEHDPVSAIARVSLRWWLAVPEHMRPVRR